MEFQKNDVYTLSIEEIGSDGEGIGKIDGYPFFVKDTVPGDVVKIKAIKVKKTYGYGRVEEIISSSPNRVEAKCPVARPCGGCNFQHYSYKKQLEYKQNKVKNCLERIGGLLGIEEKMSPIIGMEEPWYYRNKAQFPVGINKEGQIITGFYAGRTHSIIEQNHCYIQAKVNEQILKIVTDFLNEYQITTYDETTGKGLVRHILTRVGFTTKEIMVCLVLNGTKLPYWEKLVEELRQIDGMTSICINCNMERTNKILGQKVKTLWGKDKIVDSIGNIQYEISPLSFYQVNPIQTKVLYETALQYADLEGEETVWDLYCGIGTISLFLAQKAKKVYGVEIIEEAIYDARKNAALNQMDNVEFFVGKAEEVLPKQYEKTKEYADVLVVDPPRKGCDKELLETMIMMQPKKIVYVSCDPATLARDVKILCESGYEVEKVQAVDMFPQTVHVETVIMMTYCGFEAKNKE